jgi:L-asparaginase/Glu-tRNA(Gln) amidotransferase subunit D
MKSVKLSVLTLLLTGVSASALALPNITLLATGGTIEATVKLIRRLGGEVTDAAFIINLFDLGGEQRLEKQGITSYSLVPFPGH